MPDGEMPTCTSFGRVVLHTENIKQVVDKITGVSTFKGVYNEHVWTEKWQAKL